MRMVAAMPRPMGSMKMIPFTEKAICCAATAVAPKRATRSVTREKAAISKKEASPMGVPRRRSCPSVPQAGPRGRVKRFVPRTAGRRPRSQSMAAASNHMVMAMATPQPAPPRAGAPQWPKINTQLSRPFKPRAKTATYMAGRVSPMPSHR